MYYRLYDLPAAGLGSLRYFAAREKASSGRLVGVLRSEGRTSGMMILKYQSGEEIKKGDRILYHREPGQIELVAVELTGDSENDWHMRKHGGGVMILERASGRTFIPANQIDECEDLEFVSRADAP
jgi:hypothetical protein